MAFNGCLNSCRVLYEWYQYSIINRRKDLIFISHELLLIPQAKKDRMNIHFCQILIYTRLKTNRHG